MENAALVFKKLRFRHAADHLIPIAALVVIHVPLDALHHKAQLFVQGLGGAVPLNIAVVPLVHSPLLEQVPAQHAIGLCPIAIAPVLGIDYNSNGAKRTVPLVDIEKVRDSNMLALAVFNGKAEIGQLLWIDKLWAAFVLINIHRQVNFLIEKKRPWLSNMW